MNGARKGQGRQPPIGQGTEASPGLAAGLREATRALHRRAERSGVVQRILNRQADRFAYALLLRNLLPVYRQLEAGLRRRAAEPGVRHIVEPRLFRAEALAGDLVAIGGADWAGALPLLAAGEAYRCRVALAAERAAGGLIAHAYVRYLGDLNGGRLLRGLLVEQLGLGDAALSFYRFPRIPERDAFSAGYRRALDRAGAELGDEGPIVDEAVAAFRLNVALSEAVARRASESGP
jgi:heme oxygenase